MNSILAFYRSTLANVFGPRAYFGYRAFLVVVYVTAAVGSGVTAGWGSLHRVCFPSAGELGNLASKHGAGLGLRLPAWPRLGRFALWFRRCCDARN